MIKIIAGHLTNEFFKLLGRVKQDRDALLLEIFCKVEMFTGFLIVTFLLSLFTLVLLLVRTKGM